MCPHHTTRLSRCGTSHPHTQCLHTLGQPHGRAERELEPLGLRLGLAQSEKTNEQGPATQSAMHFLLRTGCDFRNVTDPSHLPCVKTHLPQTMSHLVTKAFQIPSAPVFYPFLCSCPRILKYSQWERKSNSGHTTVSESCDFICVEVIKLLHRAKDKTSGIMPLETSVSPACHKLMAAAL